MMKMDAMTLQALVKDQLSQASQAYSASEVSSDRARLMDRYLGRPYGDERDGYSKIVSRDVADTIESMMPALIKIFAGGDDVVSFEPVGKEDEENARQATDYINHVFYKQNDGFLILYTWFKDALLQKNGIAKAWWDESETRIVADYSGLSEIAAKALLTEDGVDVKASTVEREEPIEIDVIGEDGLPTTEIFQPFSVRLVRKKKAKRIRVVAIPPEEYLISSRAVSMDDEDVFQAHRREMTIGELEAMGYDGDELLSRAGEDNALDFDQERTARFSDVDSGIPDVQSSDPSRTKVVVSDCYFRCDYDGDGIPEMRMVRVVGDACYVIENEEVDDHPFASLTPIIMPHRFHGRSLAEVVEDIQEIKTVLQRQMLDSQYLANNPLMEVDIDGVIDPADIIKRQIGGAVRVSKMGSVREIPQQGISPRAFDMLEYLDSTMENRTGVTKYNQGLDADSLNKTATGINAIMNAAQERLLLVARVFGETGIKRLFRLLLALTIKHQDKAATIRLRGKWVDIDPRAWNAEMDLTVNVGLGTGNKDQMLQHLMNIYTIQKELIPFGIATPGNLYKTASKIVENSGMQGADEYFVDPSQEQQTTGAANESTQQAEQAQIEERRHQAELQQKADFNAAQIDLERQKIEAEYALKLKEIELKYGIEAAKIAPPQSYVGYAA